MSRAVAGTKQEPKLDWLSTKLSKVVVLAWARS